MDGYFYWAHFTGEETEMQKDCGNSSEMTQHKRKKRILIRVLFPEPTNEQNKALGELGCGFAESSRKDYVCSIICMTRYTGLNDPPSVISCGLHGSCDRWADPLFSLHRHVPPLVGTQRTRCRSSNQRFSTERRTSFLC